ncbi:MAG: hypothetical protein AB7N76_03525 [Planctomycetota bacterium]
MSTLRSVLCASALLLLLAQGAAAQALRIESARVGHRGRLPELPELEHGAVAGVDTWLPCEVVVSNPGDKELSGRLVIACSPFGQRRQRTEAERELSLAPGGQKRLRFPLLYDTNASWELTFASADGGRVAVLRGDGLRTRELVLPNSRPVTESLVLFARGGREGPGLERLQPKLRYRGQRDMEQSREWQVLEVAPERLPDDPLLYHRVAVLVLDDLPLARLERAQQAAILAFAASGGTVWVSTLKQRPAPGDGPLAAALPGTPAQVLERDLVPDLAAYGLQASGGQRSYLSFTPAPDATAWGADRVVIQRPFGQGLLVLAGFPLAEAPPMDRLALVRDLLLARDREPLPPPGHYEQALLGALGSPLRGATRKSVPSRGAVFLLLAGYGLLLTVPFLLARRSGRYELAWVAVAVLAALATVATFLLGELYAQTSRAVRVSFVAGGEAGPRLETSYWAVFAQRGGQLTLALRRDAAPAAGETSWRGPRAVSLETFTQDTSILVTSSAVELRASVRFRPEPAGSRARVEVEGTGLLGAWAFDEQGQPMALDVGEPGPETGPAPALLEAARAWARLVATQRGAPALLFRLPPDEEPLSDLPELSLRLGLLVAPARQALDEVAICTTLLERSAEDGEEWSFTRRLPAGTRPARLQLSLEWRGYDGFSRQQYREELGRVRMFDHAGGRWELPGWDPSPRRFCATSPLGVARGRILIPPDTGTEPRMRLTLERAQ